MALLLPFTYALDPTTALAFLLAVHSVAATTGDVTSILFGIPGESTSAALVVDGYPMTKRGEGERAITAALLASLVGSLFGAVILAAAIPVVRPLVLSIGSPEQFMLTLLAITYIAAVSGGNLAKGLTMGAAGLLLSTVGLDPIDAVPRYTFESILGVEYSVFLWDGISIIIVSLGLFGIPAIIDMMRASPIPETLVRPTGPGSGFRDVLQNLALTLRGSAIGAYIGLLPGIGGSVAQWIAYAHAARPGISSSGHRFGEGAIEGVIGPAAANNSKEGGSIVPTVAFGVPGSVSTTILLSAMMIHGIAPGPEMLDPEHSLQLTYVFVWVMVVANIIVVLLGLLALKPMTWIVRARTDALAPYLLIMIMTGAYLNRGSTIDMLLTLLFGLIGYLMVKLDWPRPPLLLGFLLGGIAESSFFISREAYGFDWMLRPGVLILGTLILVGVVIGPLFSRLSMSRRKF